jgi:hypothetical protein
VNVIVPLNVKPAGSVSTIVAAAMVGPFVMVAFTFQLNVPALPSGPLRSFDFESARLGFTQPVTVMLSEAVALPSMTLPVPPAIVALLVYALQFAIGKFAGAVTGTVILYAPTGAFAASVQLNAVVPAAVGVQVTDVESSVIPAAETTKPVGSVSLIVHAEVVGLTWTFTVIVQVAEPPATTVSCGELVLLIARKPGQGVFLK